MVDLIRDPILFTFILEINNIYYPESRHDNNLHTSSGIWTLTDFEIQPCRFPNTDIRGSISITGDAGFSYKVKLIDTLFLQSWRLQHTYISKNKLTYKQYKCIKQNIMLMYVNTHVYLLINVRQLYWTLYIHVIVFILQITSYVSL